MSEALGADVNDIHLAARAFGEPGARSTAFFSETYGTGVVSTIEVSCHRSDTGSWRQSMPDVRFFRPDVYGSEYNDENYPPTDQLLDEEGWKDADHDARELLQAIIARVADGVNDRQLEAARYQAYLESPLAQRGLDLMALLAQDSERTGQ